MSEGKEEGERGIGGTQVMRVRGRKWFDYREGRGR